jgi:hypothetical protein
MTDIKKLNALIDLVKQPKYYIPRSYQTIGGMWTVDAYERDGVKVQIMDEGYSTSVIAENLYVQILYDYKVGDYVEYKKGTIDIIENLVMKITQKTT